MLHPLYNPSHLHLTLILVLSAALNKISGHLRVTTEMKMNVTPQGIVGHKTIWPNFHSLAVANLIKVSVFHCSLDQFRVMKLMASGPEPLWSQQAIFLENYFAVTKSLSAREHPGSIWVKTNQWIVSMLYLN